MMTNMKKRRRLHQNLADVVVSAGISGDTLQKMNEICAEEGLNHSTLVRRALIREIRRISQEKEHEAEAKAATLKRPSPMPRNPPTCTEEDSNHEYQIQ